MIRDLLGDAGLEGYPLVGLVIFVAVFVAITAWILTRSKRQVRTWSELPLAGDNAEPAEPRSASEHDRSSDASRP